MDEHVIALQAGIEREQHVHDVNNKIALYENTGDGRFFWQAVLVLIDRKTAIPQSYLDKLAEIGRHLLDADTPKEMAHALEFVGDKHTHIGRKHSRAYQKRWKLASEVRIVKDLFQIKLVDAIKVVARNKKLNTGVVKKAYHDVFTAPQNELTGQPTDNVAGVINRAWR